MKGVILQISNFPFIKFRNLFSIENIDSEKNIILMIKSKVGIICEIKERLA